MAEKREYPYLNVYTVNDFCAMFGVTRRTVYNYIKDGLINCSVVGRRYFFTEEQIRDFLERGGNKETYTTGKGHVKNNPTVKALRADVAEAAENNLDASAN